VCESAKAARATAGALEQGTLLKLRYRCAKLGEGDEGVARVVKDGARYRHQEPLFVAAIDATVPWFLFWRNCLNRYKN